MGLLVTVLACIVLISVSACQLHDTDNATHEDTANIHCFYPSAALDYSLRDDGALMNPFVSNLDP